MTKITIEEEKQNQKINSLYANLWDVYTDNDLNAGIKSNRIWNLLKAFATAEREAGAKEVLQELRDIFKDTHEVGTNHLNSELDRLENK